MKNLEFKNAAVNPAKFDEEVRAALGSAVFGISTDGENVIVHVADDAKEADARLTIAGLLKDHDPRVKTEEQLALEATVTRINTFIEAPDTDTRNALTNAQLTAQVAELQGMVKLLLGAREAAEPREQKG